LLASWRVPGAPERRAGLAAAVRVSAAAAFLLSAATAFLPLAWAVLPPLASRASLADGERPPALCAAERLPPALLALALLLLLLVLVLPGLFDACAATGAASISADAVSSSAASVWFPLRRRNGGV
jgi:hypothetical protein